MTRQQAYTSKDQDRVRLNAIPMTSAGTRAETRATQNDAFFEGPVGLRITINTKGRGPSQLK